MHRSNHIYRHYKYLCNDYRKVDFSQMATPLLVLPLQLREAQPCVVAKSITDIFPGVLFTKALIKVLGINAVEGSSGNAHDWLTDWTDRKQGFQFFSEDKLYPPYSYITTSLVGKQIILYCT